jgi:hypothetical protein
MPTSLIDADSLLAVDVGATTTRAVLFDVVDGHYRFVAIGRAPTTAFAPMKDVSEGVRGAIENLQAVTGRSLLTADHQLIMPVQGSAGVGSFAASFSAGPVLKAVIVGLLNDVSLKSVHRLARSTYTRIVETIGMNDRRKPEEQIDNVLRLRPDLILMAGGVDGGASRSVQKLLEIVGLSCYLTPPEKRPYILFAGNPHMGDMVKGALQGMSPILYFAHNIRPTLETENLAPAQHSLAALYAHIRASQIHGVEELNTWSGNQLVPTAYAEGRMIRFLSEGYSKGILGVDVGASATTVAAGFGGDLTLGVYPQFGLGEGLSGLLRYTSLDDIIRWIPFNVPAGVIQEYLYQKATYPSTIPATAEDMAIEQALARQVLYLAVAELNKDLPQGSHRAVSGMMPFFEPILATGSAIIGAPTLGQGLLTLLDGVQPVGTTTIIFDQNYLLPALGASAGRIPLLPVQVLDSGAFNVLASVVAPMAAAKYGTPILNLRLERQNGDSTKMEIKQGALELLPMPVGQTGRLHLQPLHRADVGFGPGRAGSIPVNGTAMGVVIDARGRPLRMPGDPGQRQELIKKWLWTLGG